MQSSNRVRDVGVAAGAALWFVASCIVGSTGLLEKLRPPFPQVLIFSLFAALLVARHLSRSFRTWLTEVDLRVLVAIHTSRLVGLYFLYRYAHGELPWAFAVPGGIGDITVALGAVLVCLLAQPESRAGQRIFLAWNLVGTTDILFVITTAGRLGLHDPGSMRALLEMPLALLPTFLVPIILFTHFVIFTRVGKTARREQ